MKIYKGTCRDYNVYQHENGFTAGCWDCYTRVYKTFYEAETMKKLERMIDKDYK